MKQSEDIPLIKSLSGCTELHNQWELVFAILGSLLVGCTTGGERSFLLLCI